MKKVGIITGKFKPPHVGHYEAIKKIAKQNDETQVFVSPIEMDGVTGAMAVQILKEYFKDDKSVKINLAEGSPVKTAYEFIDLLGKSKDARDVTLNIYSLDSDMNRFDTVERFSGGIGKINRITTKRPEGVSGTDMRKFIKNMDKEKFFAALPRQVDKEKLWKIVNEEASGTYSIPADSFNQETDPNVSPTPISTNLGAIPTQWTNSAPYSRWDLNPANNVTQFRRNPGELTKKKHVKSFAEYLEGGSNK